MGDSNMKKDNKSWERYQDELVKGYDNEQVVSLVLDNTTTAERKVCTFTCPECGKEIQGMNRHRVEANAKTHIISKHSEIYSEAEE